MWFVATILVVFHQLYDISFTVSPEGRGVAAIRHGWDIAQGHCGALIEQPFEEVFLRHLFRVLYRGVIFHKPNEDFLPSTITKVIFNSWNSFLKLLHGLIVVGVEWEPVILFKFCFLGFNFRNLVVFLTSLKDLVAILEDFVVRLDRGVIGDNARLFFLLCRVIFLWARFRIEALDRWKLFNVLVGSRALVWRLNAWHRTLPTLSIFLRKIVAIVFVLKRASKFQMPQGRNWRGKARLGLEFYVLWSKRHAKVLFDLQLWRVLNGRIRDQLWSLRGVEHHPWSIKVRLLLKPRRVIFIIIVLGAISFRTFVVTFLGFVNSHWSLRILHQLSFGQVLRNRVLGHVIELRQLKRCVAEMTVTQIFAE